MADSGGVFVGGAWHEGDKMGYKTHDGVWHEIDKGYYKTFDGVWRECYSSGLLLGELAIGTFVNVIEQSTGLQRYIVIKHNYNGSDRTLLLREYSMSTRRFDSSSSYYANSDLDSRLSQSTYPEYTRIKNSNVGSSISPVSFISNGASISREIFVLSATELNFVGQSGEGSPIAYFDSDAKRVAYSPDYGINYTYWTRTAEDSSYVRVVTESGRRTYLQAKLDNICIRPAFTLQATMILNPQINANGAYDFII